MNEVIAEIWRRFWRASFIIKLGVLFPFLLFGATQARKWRLEREEAAAMARYEQLKEAARVQREEQHQRLLHRRFSSDDGSLSIDLPYGRPSDDFFLKRAQPARAELMWQSQTQEQYLFYGNEDAADLERQGVFDLRGYLRRREAWVSSVKTTTYGEAVSCGVGWHDALVARASFAMPKGEEPGAVVVARSRKRFHWFVMGASTSKGLAGVDEILGWIEHAHLAD
jgi:hypothetical protein